MSLRSAISTPQGKRTYVRQLFATIANRYDFITIALSYGQDRRWKRQLIELAAIGSDDRVLDLACGTGDLLFAAARHTHDAVGLDITFRMLQLAREKSIDAGGRLPKLVGGDMSALPFEDGQFDVVTAGYGLRNVPDLAASVSEIRRVLTSRGRFLSLDFNRPDQAWLRHAYLSYLTMVGSLCGLLLHGDPDTYRYIPESIRNYPGAGGVADLLRRSGFVDVRVVPLLGGLMTIHSARRA